MDDDVQTGGAEIDGEEIDDEVLVRRIRAGDGDAARILFRRYEPLLRARARRRIVGIVRRKVGESDVVQETYLAAFQGLDGFEDRGPGSFRRWLESILDHKSIDQVKRHVQAGRRSTRREESRSASATDASPAGDEPSPSAVAIRAEEREALRRAIDAMEGDDRRVLELVHVEGRGFDEAARLMNRSPDAVRMLFGRVVVRLGKRMRST